MNIRNQIAQRLRDACPTEEECLDDEEECFKKHPIHDAGGTNDVIDSVYADIDAIVDVVMEVVEPLLAN